MLVSQAVGNYHQRLTSKALTLLAQYAAYKVQRRHAVLSASVFRVNVIKEKCLRKLLGYAIRRKQKNSRYAEALQTDNSDAATLRPALLKLERVGMYWASIKGRFGMGGVGAQRRVTLAVKYGNRWLNNVAVRKSGTAKYTKAQPKLEVNDLPMDKLQAISKALMEKVPQPSRMLEIKAALALFKKQRAQLKVMQERLVQMSPGSNEIYAQEVHNYRRLLKMKQESEIAPLLREIAELRDSASSIDTMSYMSIASSHRSNI
jgi:hypothetical protein